MGMVEKDHPQAALEAATPSESLSASISAFDNLARQSLFSIFCVNGQTLEHIAEVAVTGDI